MSSTIDITLKVWRQPGPDRPGALETYDVPGISTDMSFRFRDVYDHLVRLADDTAIFQDRITSILDAHLSAVSNQLNSVMKVLTIIATLFMPLTFLTGFFGQNFDFLVTHISGGPAFLVFGIGLAILAQHQIYVKDVYRSAEQAQSAPGFSVG